MEVAKGVAASYDEAFRSGEHGLKEYGGEDGRGAAARSVAKLKEGAAEVFLMMLWMESAIIDCCRVVYKKRGICDPWLERELPVLQLALGSLTFRNGSRAVTPQTSRAAMAFLFAAVDKAQRLIDSAVSRENLSDCNVRVQAAGGGCVRASGRCLCCFAERGAGFEGLSPTSWRLRLGGKRRG